MAIEKMAVEKTAAEKMTVDTVRPAGDFGLTPEQEPRRSFKSRVTQWEVIRSASEPALSAMADNMGHAGWRVCIASAGRFGPGRSTDF